MLGLYVTIDHADDDKWRQKRLTICSWSKTKANNLKILRETKLVMIGDGLPGGMTVTHLHCTVQCALSTLTTTVRIPTMTVSTVMTELLSCPRFSAYWTTNVMRCYWRSSVQWLAGCVSHPLVLIQHPTSNEQVLNGIWYKVSLRLSAWVNRVNWQNRWHRFSLCGLRR